MDARTKGKGNRGLVELQRWWGKYYAKGKKKDRDEKSVVVKVLGLAVLFVYKIWKERCEEMLKVALPAKQQMQWDEIKELR